MRQSYMTINYHTQGYHSPGRKIPDFSSKIADDRLNKCTFINIKSACSEVLVAFQQLTEVNSKCWTKDTKKNWRNKSTSKLYDVTTLWCYYFFEVIQLR